MRDRGKKKKGHRCRRSAVAAAAAAADDDDEDEDDDTGSARDLVRLPSFSAANQRSGSAITWPDQSMGTHLSCRSRDHLSANGKRIRLRRSLRKKNLVDRWRQ